MAQTLYFNGTQALRAVFGLDNAKFEAIGGVRSKHNRYDGFQRLAGKDEQGNLLPVTRTIYRKANPSMHKCSAKCRSATGHDCECSCGGKYHGAN